MDQRQDAHDLVGCPAVEIAAAVRAGAVSAVDVLEAHLDRIFALDPRIGAFEVLRVDAARTDADVLDKQLQGSGRAADALTLAGVPVAVKDVIDVEGMPTRFGSAATSPAPAAVDDLLVARLRSAGAIIVGKTRGPELSIWGATDSVFGTTVNPRDSSRVAGGSSGGSAAAVVAGMVPLALGSDGLGSVRIPAAACGAVGIKPGRGVVPMSFEGRDEHWFGMSQYGPLATTVADMALMLDVLGGTDRFRSVRESPAPLRIAASVRSPATGIGVHEDWKAAVIDSARALHLAGHTVKPADPPYSTRDRLAVSARWTQGAARDVDDLGLDERALEPRSRAHVRAGRALARIRPVADIDVTRWRDRLERFFADWDVLITPTLAQDPQAQDQWHERSWPANVQANLSYAPFPAPWNLADYPAAAVPAGPARGSLLRSVQVVAPQGREELVLAVAAELERSRPWQRLAELD